MKEANTGSFLYNQFALLSAKHGKMRMNLKNEKRKREHLEDTFVLKKIVFYI